MKYYVDKDYIRNREEKLVVDIDYTQEIDWNNFYNLATMSSSIYDENSYNRLVLDRDEYLRKVFAIDDDFYLIDVKFNDESKAMEMTHLYESDGGIETRKDQHYFSKELMEDAEFSKKLNEKLEEYHNNRSAYLDMANEFKTEVSNKNKMKECLEGIVSEYNKTKSVNAKFDEDIDKEKFYDYVKNDTSVIKDIKPETINSIVSGMFMNMLVVSNVAGVLSTIRCNFSFALGSLAVFFGSFIPIELCDKNMKLKREKVKGMILEQINVSDEGTKKMVK